ncbi:MAG: hypothetical protein LBK99_02770 [Opitutaceae bacterium]|jgi:hypothetical protein|nr:hypothetical protein [Opitutaceae bacterium]
MKRLRDLVHSGLATAIAATALAVAPDAVAAPASGRIIPVERSIRGTTVLKIHAARAADIVVLGAGFEAGLRQGMVCRVTRASAPVAEILLVDLRRRAAAALILTLENGQSIRTGDTVSVKTIS